MPQLDGIDLNAWKDDRGACKGFRQEMIPALDQQKEELLALREADIISLLGKPDENELYKRNQKFFYYDLEPSRYCPTVDANRPKQLIIRFNAMGLAKEISIE